ncbi:uncharacterized protein LOC108452742 [Gossypium arboreum]|uniref:uncharacterized protein LOC108452742 n=1 Tax=Gossypium arboreum TaxID=29729 RepID=UPI0022F19694|nr:uncharacterized protein LOC108452742 [Gossypium arboreum]
MKQWEALENALKSMQEKALDFQFQQQERRKSREKEEEKGIASFSGSENIDKDKKDNDFGSLVDELLLLVNYGINFVTLFSHEMVIHNVSNLCDMAEAVCDEQEQQMKQSYFDLHVWALLCDEASLKVWKLRSFGWVYLLKVSKSPLGVHLGCYGMVNIVVPCSAFGS